MGDGNEKQTKARFPWGSMSGVLLGTIVGASIHRNNFSTNIISIFQDSSTQAYLISTLFGAIVAGILLASLGSSVDSYLQCKLFDHRAQGGVRNALANALGNMRYVLSTIACGALLAFFLASVCYALTQSPAIGFSAIWNWGSGSIAAAICATAGIIFICISLLGANKRMTAAAENLLRDVTQRVVPEAWVNYMGDWVLDRIVSVELQILDKLRSEAIRGILDDIKQAWQESSWKKRLLWILGIGAGVVAIIAAYGALCYVLGAVVIWIYALILSYGQNMIIPACLGGLVGLIAGIYSVRQSSKVAVTGVFITSGLVGAVTGAMLVNGFHQSENVLQVAFLHGLIASVVGLILGIGTQRFVDALRTPLGRKRWLSAIGKVAATAAVVVAIVACCAGTSQFMSGIAIGSNDITMTVYAAQGWQDSTIYVNKGDAVTIHYLSGTWSVQRRVVRPTDANGRPANPPGWLVGCSCGEPILGVSTEALVGRVGNGRPFLVGNLKEFTSTSSGDISLRMNDSDRGLSDNTGSLAIQITALRPTPTNTHTPTPTPTTSRLKNAPVHGEHAAVWRRYALPPTSSTAFAVLVRDIPSHDVARPTSSRL